MSLRARLTLAVAAIVAAAVVSGAYAAHYAARRELRAEVDRFLVGRAGRFTDDFGPSAGRSLGAPPGGAGDGPPLVVLDAVTQILGSDGAVTDEVEGQPALPVDDEDRRLAAEGGAARLRDVAVDGTRYRLLTAPVPEGGAVQIARSLAETNAVLAALRARLVLVAGAGTALAGLAAWLLARRTSEPIERLTRASEHVATTQDLATAIPVERKDEVGRLAASFNTMLVALDTSREQQKRLVADASHELRTPLTAVRTNVDFLARADTLPAEARRELLAETRLELEELTELVAELVELATDARTTEEPVEPLDLGALAADVAARYRWRSGREVTVDADDGAAVVDGRRSMVDRAVSNLVDNALKFSSSGPVEVAVRGGCVEVRDRGPGVAEEDRARVFDRFYRADAARTRPGSGLGLAIMRQIAELHGGTASLGPRPGGGTVARLDLPPAAPDGPRP